MGLKTTDLLDKLLLEDTDVSVPQFTSSEYR